MITVSYDDSTGIVRTVTYGITSREDIEDYLERLVIHSNRARFDWGRVWHLVDASHLDIQSDENLKCLAGAGIEIQKQDDKTAVVMTSDKAIRQMETMPSQFGTVVFGDFSSANAWLSASSEGEVHFLTPQDEQVVTIDQAA